MIPLKTKELLWKERKTLDEIIQEPLFKALHEAFLYLEKEPMLFPMNELAILNEVGFEVTWLCHESRFGLEPDMNQFIRSVYAHTGLKDHAMTVISMVHAVVMLVDFPPLDISKHTKKELLMLHKDSWCRRYIDAFIKRKTQDGVFFEERFKPYCDVIDIPEPPEDETEKLEGCCCAEPEVEEDDQHIRRFTLDEIVKYAQDNLSLDMSIPIQNMLYALLCKDGTAEEREKVNSIPQVIRKRDLHAPVIGQLIAHQNNLGDKSGIESLTENEQLKKLLGNL
jgi:hypothetical protein